MLCIQPSSSTKMPEPTPLPTEKFTKRFFSLHMCIVLLCLAIACLKLGKQVGWPEILTRRGQAVLYAGDCLTGCLSLFAAWALLGLVFRACSFQWNIRHVLVLMVPMGFVCSWFLAECRTSQQQARAIRMIQSHGGYIQFEQEKDNWLECCTLLGYECVGNPTTLDLREDEGVGISDDELLRLQPALESLPQLQEIKLCTFIGDSGMPALANLKGLKHLDLGHTKMTDAGLQALKNLHRLEVLNLNYTQITGEGLRHLSGTNLRELDLEGTRLSRVGKQQLPRFSKLDSLNLSGTLMTNEDLQFLAQLSLQTLKLGGTEITDEGLFLLQPLLQLESLHLTNMRLTGDGFRHLITLPNLKLLSLFGSKINDMGLQHLQYFPALENLDLAGTQVTSAGLMNLRSAPNLKFLQAQRIPLEEEELLSIAQFPKLQKFCVYDSTIGKSRLAELQRQLPNCKLIY